MLKIRCWQLWKSCQIVPLQLFWFNVTASEHYHFTSGEQILTDRLHCTPEAVTPTWPGRQFLLQDQSHFVTCQRSTTAQWTGLPTWETAGYCWQNPPSVLPVKDQLGNTMMDKDKAISVILFLFWLNRKKISLRQVQCYLYHLSHSYQMWGIKACNCQYFRKLRTYDTSNFRVSALYKTEELCPLPNNQAFYTDTQCTCYFSPSPGPLLHWLWNLKSSIKFIQLIGIYQKKVFTTINCIFKSHNALHSAQH